MWTVTLVSRDVVDGDRCVAVLRFTNGAMTVDRRYEHVGGGLDDVITYATTQIEHLNRAAQFLTETAARVGQPIIGEVSPDEPPHPVSASPGPRPSPPAAPRPTPHKPAPHRLVRKRP
jgi:hypothetical protein